MNNYDLTGQKFGRLVVIRKALTKNKRAYWYCICDCGKEPIVMGKSLRRGDTKSCGCLKMERVRTMARKLPLGESSFNQILLNYKRQARLRSLDFTLSREQFYKLTQCVCYYCGREPSQTHQGGPSKRLNGSYTYNGIDRKNNDIGYTDENSVPCCGTCNFMKKTLSVESFVSACTNVHLYRCDPIS